MKIFEKIKIKSLAGKSRLYRFCGIDIFKRDVVNGKTKIYFPYIQKNIKKENKVVFYLKVNRNDNYTFINLQHWLEIIYELGADFYIICDNDKLQNKILKNLVFKDSDIKFLKSCKNRKLKKCIKNIATKCWKKAAFAHLTSFYHAKINGFEEFWNIDADDTMLCMSPQICASAFTHIQDYAREKDISVFSLDMWRSRTKGKHWSFGAAFVRQNVDYLDMLEQNTDFSWKDSYKNYDINWNVDWFFTYLKDFKKFSIETFYIENCMFFHCGDMIFNVIGSGVYFWHDGVLTFPVLKEIYGNNELGELPIFYDCIKFDIGITMESCQDYALKNLTFLKYFPKNLKNLHCIKI